MSKTKKPPPSETPRHWKLTLGEKPGELESLQAHYLVRPSVTAAITLKHLHGKDSETVDIGALVQELSDQMNTVTDGDLARAESMLVAQAHTLDALFNQLSQRAMMNQGEYLHATDTYFRLAMRAQNQCRATLETLSEMKNPKPVAFVRQANITNGPQQVNNGSTTRAGAHAGENQNQPNKLLEELPHERLDTGTTRKAGENDPPLEAVGAVNGATDDRG